MAGGQIDDAEPPHSDAAWTIDVDTLIIGATVNDGLAHGVDHALTGLTFSSYVAGYAAHIWGGVNKEAI